MKNSFAMRIFINDQYNHRFYCSYFSLSQNLYFFNDLYRYIENLEKYIVDIHPECIPYIKQHYNKYIIIFLNCIHNIF